MPSARRGVARGALAIGRRGLHRDRAATAGALGRQTNGPKSRSRGRVHRPWWLCHRGRWLVGPRELRPPGRSARRCRCRLPLDAADRARRPARRRLPRGGRDGTDHGQPVVSHNRSRPVCGVDMACVFPRSRPAGDRRGPKPLEPIHVRSAGGARGRRPGTLGRNLRPGRRLCELPLRHQVGRRLARSGPGRRGRRRSGLQLGQLPAPRGL